MIKGPKIRRRTTAFTLLEMLVVIGIMAILFGLLAPAFQGISDSRSLGESGFFVASLLDEARQKAIAVSRTIEVRIYRLGTSPGDPFYNAVQTFEVQPDGTVKPTDKVQTLPVSVAISETHSSLIAEAPTTGADGSVGSRTGVGYVSFRFGPSGSTNLPVKSPLGYNWYLTLVNRKSLANLPSSPTTAPAKNYAAVQIDPIAGTVKLFRP